MPNDIEGRQNIDSATQSVSSPNGLKRFNNLYALNRDNQAGAKMANQVTGQVGQAQEAAFQDSQANHGQLSAGTMGKVNAAQEQVNAWGTEAGRAGQIQAKTGQSAPQATYGSLYMANPALSQMQQRYGNLSQLVQGQVQRGPSSYQYGSQQGNAQFQGAVYPGQTQHLAQPQGSATGKGDRVQHVGALDSMLKQGQISDQDYYRAQQDPAYAQQLMNKNGYK